MTRREKFNNALAEIENTKGVFILQKENDYYHFISFIYRGYRIYVQRNEYAIDENHPGEVIFMIHRITADGCSEAQLTFFENYENLSSVDAMIDAKDFKCNGPIRSLDYSHLGDQAKQTIEKILAKYGEAREKEVWNNAHFCVATDTWNKDHKVVDVLKMVPEEDGYFDGFSVDLVTRSICA